MSPFLKRGILLTFPLSERCPGLSVRWESTLGGTQSLAAHCVALRLHLAPLTLTLMSKICIFFNLAINASEELHLVLKQRNSDLSPQEDLV